MRKIESLAGEVYRGDMEGAEGRAREATRSTGPLLQCMTVIVAETGAGLKRSASEERMEQVREFDGEQAYEKMRRAVEKADQDNASQEKARQEKARQVERARLEWNMQETARQSRERRGPERRWAGAGLWPQPLGLVLLEGVREWAERIREEV